MSDYVKSTNFYAKDALVSGNPDKIIKGADIDTEFNNIATAVATKANLNSPTFTGIPLAPTASPGTSTTQLATTAFVQNVAGALGTMSSQNASAVAITGGTITGLSSALPVLSGGTGVTTSTGTGSVVLSNSPTLVTPNLGTPSAIVLTNATGTASSLNTGVGAGQSWTNVTSSRAFATTYTNSTGKPIEVLITGQVVSAPNGNNYGSFSINGTVVGNFGVNAGNQSAILMPVSFIVPNGATYSAQIVTGLFGLVSWWELR